MRNAWTCISIWTQAAITVRIGEGSLMVRPSGWDILGLDNDPTPGDLDSVQNLAKQFGDFAHDVEAAYRCTWPP
jgi:hypothetical protein